MDEHPNVGVVRRQYEAFAAGDLATLRSLWTEDILFHVKGIGELDGEYAGPDQVIEFLGRLAADTNGTLRLDIHAVLADDEHSVSLLTQHAERLGRSLDSNMVHVTHMREGKTSEFWAAVVDPAASVAFWA